MALIMHQPKATGCSQCLLVCKSHQLNSPLLAFYDDDLRPSDITCERCMQADKSSTDCMLTTAHAKASAHNVKQVLACH